MRPGSKGQRASPKWGVSQSGPARSGRTTAFFALTFALSAPFWLLGALTRARLVAGLPLSSLMVVAPALSALVLSHAEAGRAGVRGLLARSFDFHRIRRKAWYAPALLTPPVAAALTGLLLHAAGRPPAMPQVSAVAAVAMLGIFFLAALCEELGWSGYATDPMQARHGALATGILLGLVWAAWHLLPLLQMGRSPAWIAGWALSTVASRVLIVWIYDNCGRSVFAASAYHTTSNMSTMVFAGWFDPVMTGAVMAVMAAIVTAGWGPKTLTGRANGEPG